MFGLIVLYTLILKKFPLQDDKFELEYSKESLNDLTSEGILQIVNDFFCRDDN